MARGAHIEPGVDSFTALGKEKGKTLNGSDVPAHELAAAISAPADKSADFVRQIPGTPAASRASPLGPLKNFSVRDKSKPVGSMESWQFPCVFLICHNRNSITQKGIGLWLFD